MVIFASQKFLKIQRSSNDLKNACKWKNGSSILEGGHEWDRPEFSQDLRNHCSLNFFWSELIWQSCKTKYIMFYKIVIREINDAKHCIKMFPTPKPDKCHFCLLASIHHLHFKVWSSTIHYFNKIKENILEKKLLHAKQSKCFQQ